MALTRPRYSQIPDSDYKNSCKIVTTTDITLSGGAPLTYDGVTLVQFDRVLVAGQADKTQNGIYSVQTLGTGSNGSWARSTDANTNERLTAGMNTFIEEGTYAEQFWHLLTPGPIVLGVTELSFGQITGNAAGSTSQIQYNAGGIISGTEHLRYDVGTGNVIIDSGVDSTSNVTGALVVNGGLGISGNLWAEGNIYSVGSRVLTQHDLETVTFTANYISKDPANVAVPVVGTSTIYGTHDFGTLADITTYGDYNTTAQTGYYSVHDAATAPGWIAYIGFTGISSFNRAVYNINYTASSGHTVDIDFYNYQNDQWDTFATYSGSGNWQQFALGLIDHQPYIDNTGNVTTRIYHVNFGNVQHRTWIDYVALEQSVTGGQGPRGATGPTGPSGTYSGGYISGSIVTGGNIITSGNFISNSGNVSTGITSGALVLTGSGGAGIGGNVNVGGNITAAGNVSADKFYTTNGLFWSSNGLAFSSGLEVSEIDTSNALSNISTQVTSIRFDRDTGIYVNELNPGNVRVSLGSTFKTWHVPGQSDLVAVAEDQVTFFGNGIDITTHATAPKAITFIANNSVLEANIGAYQIYSNANVGSIYNNLNTLDANVGSYQIYANANVGSIYNNLNTLDANIGAYQIYSNANVGSIYNSVTTLDANVGSYQLYANANLATIVTNIESIVTNANANLAAYLTTSTSGNIAAGNIVVTGNIIAGNIISSDGSNHLYLSNGGNLSLTTTGNINLYSNSYITKVFVFGTDYSYGSIKVTADGMGKNYLQFYDSVPSISDTINIGDTVYFDIGSGTQSATILGPLIDFPGNKYSPGHPGFLLSTSTVGGTDDYNVGSLQIVGQHAWTFASNGGLIFPDSTVQNTAFTINSFTSSNIVSANVVTGNITSSGNVTIDGNLFVQGINVLGNLISTAALAAGTADEIGILYTYIDSNAAIQASNIAEIFANIGAFETYANSKIGTNPNGNLVVTSSTEAYSSITGALVVNGGVGIGGNLWVAGNIYASNLISINTSTLTVTDPMLYLTASSPFPYNYDIGFYSAYVGGTPSHYQHTGVVRNYTNDTWTFFSNVTTEPGGTINWSEANIIYDAVKLGTITVANNTPSSNWTTGALTVAGGVGVAGNIYLDGLNANLSVVVGDSHSDKFYTTSGIFWANGTAYSSGSGGGSGTPGGSDKQIQFNNSGSFGGASDFTYSYTSGNVVVGTTTDSVSTTTGALVVRGGLGVVGNVTTNNVYTTNGVFWSGNGAAYGSAFLYTAATSAPSNPTKGDQWFDTTEGILYEYVDDGDSLQWIDIQSSTISAGGGTAALIGSPSISGSLSVTGNVTAANVSTGNVYVTSGVFWANGTAFASFPSTLDANIGTLYNTNITTQANIGTLYLGNIATQANIGTLYLGNIATQANIGTLYNTNNTTQANIGTIYLGNIATQANLGAYQLYANSNAATQATAIVSLYTNANTNTAAYLTLGSNIGSGTTTANLVANATTTATTSSTGALVVRGGAGIAGNVYADGNIILGSSTSSNLVANATTTSTSITTGALVVRGGVGIAGNVYAQGNVILGSGTASNLVAAATTTSTSTTTGALVVRGGAGIAGNVTSGNVVTGNIYVTSGLFWSNGSAFSSGSSIYTASNLVAASGTASTNTTTGALVVAGSGGIGIGGAAYIGGAVTINSVASTGSTTTGALVVAGGVGVAGDLIFGGFIQSLNGVTSTSTSTGAITAQNGGGMGVTGNLYVGNEFVVPGGGKITSTGLAYLLEKANVVASVPATTINVDLATVSVMYWTGNATANATANIRGTGNQPLNSLLATGQSVTAVLFFPNGASNYLVNTIKIDNTTVTPAYQGNSAPVLGNSNSIDIYSFTILKTADATYKVFASQTQFMHPG